MKKIPIIVLTILGVNSYCQESNFYNLDINQDVNATINKTVDVSGNINVNKNISTIDYGELALANAQSEKTRLESLKYADERDKQIALEIAENPVKAYDYGYQKTFIIKGKKAKPMGFKKFTTSYRVPHESVFVQAGAGRFENVSIDGVTTELIFMPPLYNKDNVAADVEKNLKSELEDVKVGQLNDMNENSIFVHKKDLDKATIFGIKGFKSTLIWEDDYQYTITNNYASINENEGNGIQHFCKVRYYGDKDEITFEELEGRKFYLKRLIEKIVSTAIVTDVKY